MTAPRPITVEGAALAPLIDHTLLRPDATRADVVRLCEEAIEYNFATVCVYPARVPLATETLRNTPVRVCTVAGFPHGASTTDAKVREAVLACQSGAAEVDMVLAVFAVKDGDAAYAERDIRAVVEAVSGHTVKVILETGLLSDAEKVIACRLAVAAGAHFVKTSTGMGAGGATVQDIRLMRQTVGSVVGVKASGGIRTLADARAMVSAGASRIGTSSGVAIVTST